MIHIHIVTLIFRWHCTFSCCNQICDHISPDHFSCGKMTCSNFTDLKFGLHTLKLTWRVCICWNIFKKHSHKAWCDSFIGNFEHRTWYFLYLNCLHLHLTKLFLFGSKIWFELHLHKSCCSLDSFHFHWDFIIVRKKLLDDLNQWQKDS